ALQKGAAIEVAGAQVVAADVFVTRTPKGDVVIATEGPLTVALEVELTPELVREGLAREIISKVQRLRKDTGLEVTDRIKLTWETNDAELLGAIQVFGGYIAGETLAGPYTAQPTVEATTVDVDGRALHIYLERA
ncbi:MAG: isoleucyl-tRNA synthetase, partial [Bradymonadia bacterium]